MSRRLDKIALDVNLMGLMVLTVGALALTGCTEPEPGPDMTTIEYEAGGADYGGPDDNFTLDEDTYYEEEESGESEESGETGESETDGCGDTGETGDTGDTGDECETGTESGTETTD